MGPPLIRHKPAAFSRDSVQIWIPLSNDFRQKANGPDARGRKGAVVLCCCLVKCSQGPLHFRREGSAVNFCLIGFRNIKYAGMM